MSVIFESLLFSMFKEKESIIKERYEEELYKQINIEKLYCFLDELSQSEKESFIKIAKIPIAKRKGNISTILLRKEVGLLCRANNIEHNQPIIMAIMDLVLPLLLDDNINSLEEFICNRDTYIERFGPYHFYWAFYFFPYEENEKAMWEQQLNHLTAYLDEHQDSFIKQGTPVLTNNSDKETTQIDNESTNHKLEEKIKNEMERRIQLEHQIAAHNKIMINKDKDISKLRDEREKIDKELLDLKQKLLKQNDQMNEERQKMAMMQQERQQKWNVERDALLSRLNEKNALLRQHEKYLKEMEAKIEQLQQNISNFEEENERLSHVNEMIRWSVITSMIDQEIYQISNRMINTIETENKTVFRNQIGELVAIANQIEHYILQFGESTYGFAMPKVEIEESNNVAREEERKEEGEEKKENNVEIITFEEHVSERDKDIKKGTFYRRDHGGYVELENGERFNLNEFLVLKLELEHEAEVECWLMDNGKYHITLLFQGDDDYAPIIKREGYVKLGLHHQWYCVDLEGNEYPIHYRDIEILHLYDGTPCRFNLQIGGKFARISRLFNTKERNLLVKESHASDQKSSKQERDMTTYPKVKKEPFLEGCTIAIVGGIRKWFEDVVAETGAELVHDDGYTPSRVLTGVSRSNALFLLLTANSHSATGQSIKVAKENNIPHFTIEGSKSNLRSLLWENRDIIKANKAEIS